MEVAGLWRYPVKSLGGEALSSASLTADGVAGDRIVHVRGPRGPLTGRTRQELLTLPVRTRADGTPLVEGQPWDSPQVAELVRRRAGDGAQLIADTSPQRFDVLNLLVATDEAVARFGHDVRRLQALEIGDVLVGIESLRARCIVTTIDPDTGEQDLDVLRQIRRDFGGELALNCWVIRPGTISVGDQARLVPSVEQPAHYGGWIVGASYPHLTVEESTPDAG
jgi:uncharacterized protein YcbX